MKIYHIETQWGNFELKAQTLDDAKTEVRWDYANSGKRKIVVKEYVLKDTKEYTINTDY